MFDAVGGADAIKRVGTRGLALTGDAETIIVVRVRNATFEYYAAHLLESPSACCRTVWTAAS